MKLPDSFVLSPEKCGLGCLKCGCCLFLCSAQGQSGSFDAALGIIRETADYVVKVCSSMYQVVQNNTFARISALFALSVALVTALLNTLLTGYLHKNVLPSVTAEVSTLLEREVRLLPQLVSIKFSFLGGNFEVMK